MKEHPIIFSTEMVKAILDGRKTMTRRVIKPQPHEEESLEVGIYTPALIDNNGDLYPADYQLFGAYTLDGEVTWKCPYGQVGDRLWVRETWDLIYGADGDYLIYKADDKALKWFNERKRDGSKITWKPSIHMPRWASRITLEITEVRVERVQEISRNDAIAEGIIPMGGLMDTEPWCASFVDQEPMKHPEVAFGRLWDSLNARNGWDTNPWVWVIGFKEV